MVILEDQTNPSNQATLIKILDRECQDGKQGNAQKQCRTCFFQEHGHGIVYKILCTMFVLFP